MSRFTMLWLVWIGGFFALEGFALATDHKRTLSQTLQRAFSHAPWLTACIFGAAVAWFTLHIWGGRLVHATKATVHVAAKVIAKKP